MTCGKCGAEMVPQLVAEQKKRSLLSILLWLILAFCTCGIGLLILPFMRGRKTNTQTYFVCPNCGYRVKK